MPHCCHLQTSQTYSLWTNLSVTLVFQSGKLCAVRSQTVSILFKPYSVITSPCSSHSALTCCFPPATSFTNSQPFCVVSPSQNKYRSKNMPSVPPLEFQTLLVMLTTSRKSTFCIQFSLLSEENLSATPQPPWGSSPRHTEMLLKTCVFPGWEVAHPLNNTSTTFRGPQGLQPRAGEGIE